VGEHTYYKTAVLLFLAITNFLFYAVTFIQLTALLQDYSILSELLFLPYWWRICWILSYWQLDVPFTVQPYHQTELKKKKKIHSEVHLCGIAAINYHPIYGFLTYQPPCSLSIADGDQRK
jgi:hypothetical protein